MHASIHPSVYLSGRPPVNPSFHVSVRPTVSTSDCPSIPLSHPPIICQLYHPLIISPPTHFWFGKIKNDYNWKSHSNNNII